MINHIPRGHEVERNEIELPKKERKRSTIEPKENFEKLKNVRWSFDVDE
jgi:hypothetical protein